MTGLNLAEYGPGMGYGPGEGENPEGTMTRDEFLAKYPDGVFKPLLDTDAVGATAAAAAREWVKVAGVTGANQ